MARFRRRTGDPAPAHAEVQLGMWDTISLRASGLARRVAATDPAHPAFVVLCSVLALFVVGFLLQASHAATTRGVLGYEQEVIEQARYRAAAMVCLFMGARYGPQRIQRFIPHIFAISILLLIAVWIPGLSKPEHDANRWVRFMGFSVQTSEIARVALVLWTADRCARLGERMMSSWRTVLPVFLTGLVTCLLVLLQPDLGGCLVLMCCFFLTLWVGGASAKKTVYPFVLLAGGAAMVAFMTKEYVRDRINFFLHPGSNEQVSTALQALWSGGIAGDGIGQGIHRRLGLIKQDNDFVFSLVGEEFGLIGMIVVIALFACIAWFGLRMVLAIGDRFRALASFGLLLCILLPALIHMMVAVGLAPPKGMTLPFLSDGGTSLVMSSLACGLALGASRALRITGAPTRARRSLSESQSPSTMMETPNLMDVTSPATRRIERYGVLALILCLTTFGVLYMWDDGDAPTTTVPGEPDDRVAEGFRPKSNVSSRRIVYADDVRPLRGFEENDLPISERSPEQESLAKMRSLSRKAREDSESWSDWGESLREQDRKEMARVLVRNDKSSRMSQERSEVVEAKASRQASGRGGSSPSKGQPLEYIVKDGDYLGKIAQEQLGSVRHLKRLKEWNNLKSDDLRVGQILLLPVIGAKAPVRGKDIKAMPAPESKEWKYVTVQDGESLWVIAERYLGDGTRYPEIIKWNDLSSEMVHPGKELRMMSAQVKTLAMGGTGR